MTKAEVLVRARVEDPEVQAERAEITKNKTVQELSQINSLADFPIPKTIETLINKEKLLNLEKSRYCTQKYDFNSFNSKVLLIFKINVLIKLAKQIVKHFKLFKSLLNV